MNATEQARRSDALYYSGNGGISRRWLCDKVASLERENAELRELLRVAITYCVNGYCGKDDGCPLRLTDYDCKLLTKASELGVEVDE